MDKLADVLAQLIQTGAPLAGWVIFAYYGIKLLQLVTIILVSVLVLTFARFVASLCARHALLRRFIAEGDAHCDHEARKMIKAYIVEILDKEKK